MEKTNFWKHNEDKLLKELEEYLIGTYSTHYVDPKKDDQMQTIDKLRKDRVEGFCAGNVEKYIDRYDRKGTPKADLFKVIHYTLLLLNHLKLYEDDK